MSSPRGGVATSADARPPPQAVCGSGVNTVVRSITRLFTSPIDRLIFPTPRPSYDDSTFPWNSSDLIWLRDALDGHQFPTVVIEPQARLLGGDVPRVVVCCCCCCAGALVAGGCCPLSGAGAGRSEPRGGARVEPPSACASVAGPTLVQRPRCAHAPSSPRHAPQDGAPPVRVIIYCHGNACDIGEVYLNLKQCAPTHHACATLSALTPAALTPRLPLATPRSEAARWRALVVVVEYPGYGLSPGSACSEGVDRHVRAAYEHFTVTLGVRSERVVIFGASVGTGPASRLAAQVQAAGGRVGALILQSPFTCVRDAAAALVGSVAYVMFERWDNAEALKALTCPLLIVHGTADDVIPFSQGVALRELREAAKLPCVFHAQQGATHNNYRAREDLSVPVACVPSLRVARAWRSACARAVVLGAVGC
jgi:pimeloyl-ACP methyl ester carboxylesterase